MSSGGSGFPVERLTRVLIAAAALGCASSALAQDPAPQASGEYVAKLKTCQAIADDVERLACFDRSVGEIVAANDAGDVRIIDREEIRQTRRQLFGLSVPEVGVLERDSKDKGSENELFETTIASATYLSDKKLRFTTAEGAVWEINNLPRNLQTVKAGQKVNFKKATFGFYFVRINGQLGVKGKRVQ